MPTRTPALSPPSQPSPEPRPLVCARDEALQDDLLRLAAAGNAEAELVSEPLDARPFWTDAPLVLVGVEVAAAFVEARLPHRPHVLLVAHHRVCTPDDPEVWQLATDLGADRVAFLPTAEPYLVDRYAASVAGPAAEGRIVAVVGGRGGAGASVLAAALAVTGARTGARTMLVDADPLGGGLDLIVGRETSAGVRWPDLAEAAGRISPPALQDALPRVGELCVLSWDRGELLEISADAADTVLDAGRRASDLVVVDLPRYPDEGAIRALQWADRTLLVLPAEVRACAAAARVAAAVRPHCAHLSCVVRGPAPAGLRGGDVAAALQLPLAGVLKAEPHLAAALDRGDPPAGTGRGPLAEFCRRYLADLDASSTLGRAS